MKNGDLMNVLATINTSHKKTQVITLLSLALLVGGGFAFYHYQKSKNLSKDKISLQNQINELESKVDEHEINMQNLSCEIDYRRNKISTEAQKVDAEKNTNAADTNI